jgi:hypothetical protein
MSALEWIDRPFIVIDAWQYLGFAQSILKNFAGSWIVIYRRHEQGPKWYLLNLVEFESKVKGRGSWQTFALRTRCNSANTSRVKCFTVRLHANPRVPSNHWH